MPCKNKMPDSDLTARMRGLMQKYGPGTFAKIVEVLLIELRQIMAEIRAEEQMDKAPRPKVEK